ncbi:MAG: tetratricopeptide repeat protein [Archangium sp.]|nr:tetratricopeptide repeat protein [Archangium sp.]
MNRLFLILVALASLTSFAQRNPDLEKAQQLLAQKKYAEALKSIEAAAKKGGLERESLLTLLESRGLAQASLGQTEKAEESFRSVLQLEPRRDLTGKYTGKVVPVIAAAKEWFKTNGGIELGPLDPGVEAGRVKQISLFVKNDPLKLISQAKFYVRKDGGAWKPVEAAMANGAATTDVDADVVEWWAELLSERKDQLMFLGSAGKPIKQTAPAPVAVAKVEEKKADAPAAEPEKKLTPAEKPDERLEAVTMKSSPLRPVGFVLLGLGVAAAGVGTYFGVTSAGQRDSVRADLAAGNTSQVELYNRDQTAISNGAIANVLWAAGGALGVTGLIMVILGHDVAVVPGAGGGVTVLGKF